MFQCVLRLSSIGSSFKFRLDMILARPAFLCKFCFPVCVAGEGHSVSIAARQEDLEK